MTTVAGTGTPGYTGDGGAATAAEIQEVFGVATDRTGNVYFTDLAHINVRKITPAGIITTIAGGSYGFSGDGGPATAAEFGNPWGLATDGAGNLYIADRDNERIRKINTSGIISTVAGNGTNGFRGDGGPATAAELNLPMGVAVDSAGNLYIADQNNHRIRKVSTSGIITTIAGSGAVGSSAGGYSGDGGPATDAQLNFPQGVAVDNSGNIYIPDGNNYRLRKVNASGIISTIAGNGTATNTGDGGPATAATIAGVQLILDPTGNIFFNAGNKVRVIDTAGIIHTFAGTGTPGFSGDGGPATSGELSSNFGIASDTSGIIYVADTRNYRLRKIAPAVLSVSSITGTSTLAAGSSYTFSDSVSGGTWRSSASGTASVSSSGVVTGVAAGSATISYSVTNGCGTLVATHAVTIIGSTAAGCNIISTIAGNGTSGYNGEGTATVRELSAPSGIATDAAGNIYVTDNNNNRIRKITPGGIISTICGTGSNGYTGDGGPATAAKIYGPWGITIDAVGNIVFADRVNCAIRKIDTSGVITTIAGTGTSGFSGDGGAATAAKISYLIGVTSDTSGNIYFADVSNNRIRRITPAGIIKTVAGNGSGGYSGDGGAATSTKLNSPEGVFMDNSGNLLIADEGNNRVRKVTPAGIISTIAGNGTAGYSGDGGAATAAELSGTDDVEADSSGNIYLVDVTNNSIRKITPAGIITTIAGTGTAGFSGDGGAATAGQLNHPTGVTVDNSSNIYIADPANNRVRKISSGLPVIAAISGADTLSVGSSVVFSDAAGGGTWSSANTSIATVSAAGIVRALSTGLVNIAYATSNSCGSVIVNHALRVTPFTGTATCNIMTTIAGDGTASFSGDASAATAAEYNAPNSVATDRAGNVYIADYNNHRIRKISAAGISSTIAGTGTPGYSGDGGLATAAELNYPSSVYMDAANNLYISDNGNYRVRKISAAGIITTIAGTGTLGFSGDGGAATAARVQGLSGITTDATGNIYIADLGNQRVRKINTSGIISTIAGNSSGGYSGDGGPATAAELMNPMDVVTDTTGNLYITDGLNNVIRKINTSGTISTYAGTGISGFSGDGGAATAARLNYPRGISIDKHGNLYFADYASHAVRKISTSGTITTIAGTGTAGFSGDGGEATAATMHYPADVAIDADGNVIISDNDNNRIREIVTAPPSVKPISGTTSMCTGATATLTDSTTGGVWGSYYIGIATVTTTGTIYGVSGGLDTISYSKTNACGTTSQIHTLTIRSSALGGFITGTPTLCQGTSVTFVDTTSGGSWSSSAPGIVTVSSSGVVTGVSAGSADVIYTVSGSCGSAGSSYGVTILPLPDAGTISGPASMCLGTGTIALTDTITGGTWGTSTPTIATIDGSGTVTGVVPGTDTITYARTNSCGTTTAIHLVSVNAAPLAGTITGASTLCLGSNATYSATGTTGTWAVTNTNATATDSLITSAGAGSDSILFIATNACGQDTAYKAITIFPLPYAGVISGAADLCVGASITLAETVTGGSWSATNGHSTVAAGRVTGISSGADTILYTVTDAHCTNAASKIITATVAPNAGTIAGPATICQGTTIIFTDSAAGGFWSCTNGNATASGAAISGAVPGRDTIVYTVSNHCGSASTRTSVLVSPALVPGVTIINPADSPCITGPITLDAVPVNGGSEPTYSWFKNGTYTDTGATFTYAASFGDVIVCRMSSTAQCRTADSAESRTIIHSTTAVTPFVTIHIVHDTTFYPGEIIAFDAEETYGGSNPQYQWYQDGNPVAGATTNAYSVMTYFGETVFCVVASNLACITKAIDTSNIVTIYTVNLSVNDPNHASIVSLFPDPSNGQFTITGTLKYSTEEVAGYEVTDVTGRQILNGNIPLKNGTFKQNITLSNELPDGQYFIKIHSDAETRVLKFILRW